MYEYHELDEQNMRGSYKDWRKALRTPATYRMGNTVRLQPQFMLITLTAGLFLLVVYYYSLSPVEGGLSSHIPPIRPYNTTYPLTAPLKSGDLVTYRIGIVADLDTDSKGSKPHTYNSYLKKGSLSYNPVKSTVSVTWDTTPATVLSSTYSHKGRGMELSELIVYDGRLLSFDDRSGMVFEILNNRMIPWVVLIDGNGVAEKGFKSEWATVKDEMLYVGSMGKEWTTAAGEFQTYDPMWMKIINMNGQVHHLNWVNQFKLVRSSIGIKWPGYMIHESGVWSPVHQKWFFLPRRCSHQMYNETLDEVMGCNYLITSDSNFSDVHAVQITKLDPKFGFSSFKFIPGSNDEVIVALKTTEFEGKTATYITVFKIDGTELLPNTLVENLKYEGLEFI